MSPTNPAERATDFLLRPVAIVQSPLSDPETAPKQGEEGAPSAWLVFVPGLALGLQDIGVGDALIVLTWLHQADREVLAVHPRDDLRQPLTGVFSTRSADRPNPIGLHPVTVEEVDGTRVRVCPLEAIDGTPVIDVKPAL